MIKIISLLIFFISCVFISRAQVNSNSHYVKGHYRNGTYVDGYYRTNPNQTKNDNYSTYPNVNPHTGKQGTISPEYYSAPPNNYSNSNAVSTKSQTGYSSISSKKKELKNITAYQLEYVQGTTKGQEYSSAKINIDVDNNSLTISDNFTNGFKLKEYYETGKNIYLIDAVYNGIEYIIELKFESTFIIITIAKLIGNEYFSYQCYLN